MKVDKTRFEEAWKYVQRINISKASKLNLDDLYDGVTQEMLEEFEATGQDNMHLITGNFLVDKGCTRKFDL